MDSDTQKLSGLLVDQCPDGIIFADPDGRIALWNAAAEQIFGYPRAEVVGESLDIIIPEKLRSGHWQGFDQAIQARTTKHKGAALPTKAACRDGSTIYVELSFAVVLDTTGEAIGATAQVRDITERYEKERANRKRLRELEQQLGEQGNAG